MHLNTLLSFEKYCTVFNTLLHVCLLNPMQIGVSEATRSRG